jgi:hypothetical protein
LWVILHLSYPVAVLRAYVSEKRAGRTKVPPEQLGPMYAI